MHVDEQLRALSHDLDGSVADRSAGAFRPPRGPGRPVVFTGAAAVAIVGVLAVSLVASRGPDDVDLSTVTDQTGSTSTSSSIPTASTIVDPPVTDPSPLRLGLDVPGLEPTAAVEACVPVTVGPTPCALPVGPADATGRWEQHFRLDPDEVTSPGVFISGVPAGPGVTDPATMGGTPVEVPGGTGYLLPSSVEGETTVVWRLPDGVVVWVSVTYRSSADALALVAALQPRPDHGYELPDGTELVQVADVVDHQWEVPSGLAYAGRSSTVQISVFPGDRTDFEMLAPLDGLPDAPRPGWDPLPPARRITVRGRPAFVSEGRGSGSDASGQRVTAPSYRVVWYEPERGAVVTVDIHNNLADPGEVPLEVLDHLVELDEASFQAVVAVTPPLHVAP